MLEISCIQAQVDLGLASSSGPLITSRKLPLPPIDISDLPGVENLNATEKDVNIVLINTYCFTICTIEFVFFVSDQQF